ncbi:MAG: PIN domain-containing protein [Phycisphaerae bacterium]|nr:PIN domain-containing protein [Phycisphaerae bacterium]
MFLVDTNVLVYAADEDMPEHERCREAVEQWRGLASTWYTTWGILYEFLRVTTHPRVLRRPWRVAQAWGFVEALLASPGLSVLVETQRHSAVAEQVLREMPQLSGNVLHDTHTAILMREHGLRRICTRDADFHRFDFIEVIDPLKG